MREITESNWLDLYYGIVFDSTWRIGSAPIGSRYDIVNHEAYLVGQLVAADVVNGEAARDMLVDMATDEELPYFAAIVDAAFRACLADWHRNFGAGLRNG